MTASTLSTFDGLMKERYVPTTVEELIYPDNVLLGMLEKKGDTGMVGDALPVPLITAVPQGVGAVFSTAQTNAVPTVTNKFVITSGSYYGICQIDDKVLAASRSNAGAFLDNKSVEMDGLYQEMGEMLSVHLWGNGGGSIGRRASAATNDITLTNAIDAQNFEIGMSVRASSADGTGASDTQRTGSTTVSGVNRATGVVSLVSAAGITSFGDNDYIFRDSDFAGDQLIVVIKGVQAFITATDSPAALWGITAATRATDPQRFAGCRVASVDIQGLSYEERIKKLLAYMTGRFKARMPDAGFLNPEDFQILETMVSSKGIRALEDENTKFGYAKIDITASGGRIPIYTDRHCPKGTFFALRQSNWWISTIGELMHPQNGDGLQMLRRSTTTDYEFRLISYPLLACNAPKNNGRVSLTD